MRRGSIAAVLVAALLPSGAGAHGDARWIMEDARTRWCCGPSDCAAVPSRIKFTPRGWTVDGLSGALLPGQRGLFWGTPDERPWACHFGRGVRLRCLFLPEAKN